MTIFPPDFIVVIYAFCVCAKWAVLSADSASKSASLMHSGKLFTNFGYEFFQAGRPPWYTDPSTFAESIFILAFPSFFTGTSLLLASSTRMTCCPCLLLVGRIEIFPLNFLLPVASNFLRELQAVQFAEDRVFLDILTFFFDIVDIEA